MRRFYVEEIDMSSLNVEKVAFFRHILIINKSIILANGLQIYHPKNGWGSK